MEGIIPPESELVLTATATAEDAQAFSENVKISVTEGDELGFSMKCKGTGTTIQCEENLDEGVNFGDVYTHREVQKVFVLFNRSKKPQDVEWIQEKVKDKKGEIKPNVFTVNPLKAKLNPKSFQEFTLTGTKPKPGEVQEMLECQTTVGKGKLTVYKMDVKAIFNNPLLEFTTRAMDFYYTGRLDPNSPPTPTDVLTNAVTITNISPLTLDIILKTQEDFSVDCTKMTLAPNTFKDVQVSFIVAGCEEKRESKDLKQQLTITYPNHPQKDKIDLKGKIVFPNLLLQYSNIDFGAVLNDTETRSYITITNVSEVPVKCRWYFEEPEAAPGKNTISLNQVFDVVPIRSSLGIGESEEVEFVFFGHKGRTAKATAICIVEDGPEYRVKLRGEASGIDYKFDKNVVEYGSLMYESSLDKDFTIQNTGRVEFPFAINTDGVKPPRVCIVQPMSGKIKPGEKVKVSVRLTPGMPEILESEFLEVQIAHLEAEVIKITGNGTFPNCWTSLPRVPDDVYTEVRTTILEAPSVFSTPVLVEAECDRKLFCNYLEIVANPTESKRTKAPVVSPVVSSGDKSIPGYFLSRYGCVFGSVIKGMSCKMKFQIRNIGFSSLSIDLDKKNFNPEFITFTPDKFKSLSGAPTNETMDIEVEMQTASREVGQLEMELPVTVKGGPSIALVFRANILVPDVAISRMAFNFGLTSVGRLRSDGFQLTNEMVVPIDWSISDKLTRSPFSMEPSKGRLKPGEQCNVIITFRPLSEQDFSSQLQLKVNHNPKAHQIRVKGKGAELNIDIEPLFADFIPALPHTTISTVEVTITNKSIIPVEVYSLEFDETWVEEERILRVQDGFERNEIMSAPREVGQTLPSAMIAFAEKLKEAAATKKAAAEEVSQSVNEDDRGHNAEE